MARGQFDILKMDGFTEWLGRMWRRNGEMGRMDSTVQGDHSACSKPLVDNDLKVAFYDKVLILKRNFHINVNGRL